MVKKTALTIVKLGSYIVSNPDVLKDALIQFSSIKGPKILVHGGGAKASLVADKMGIETTLIDGRRITDKDNLEVVLMVYAGLINKQIIASLQGVGCNSIGLSGADGNCILAEKRAVHEIDYGFVGDVKGVNTGLISTFLDAGIAPVFCAISHDHEGTLLNTNGDTIAAELAIALSAYYDCSLLYCFDKDGVLMDINNPLSLIKEMNAFQFDQLKSGGFVHSGMLPKLNNGFYALNKEVKEVRLGKISLMGKQAINFTKLVLK